MPSNKVVHEWHEEAVEDTFWGKKPHPVIARLAELETDGWTILTVQKLSHSSDFQVVCFR